jgi:hypothetical protein
MHGDSASMEKIRGILSIAVAALMIVSLAPAYVNGTHANVVRLEEVNAPAASTAGAFALTSYFTSGGGYSSYGWHLISGNGKKDSISTSTTYFGEPSLSVSDSELVNTNGVIAGDQFVSFQVALNPGNGMGMFGIVNGGNQILALVGVSGNSVYGGTNTTNMEPLGHAPSQSVYSGGWLYITANILNSSTQRTFSWTMQLFVDGSNTVFANLSVPDAYQYAGIALINQGQAAAYFTDIVFTTYEIPIYLPGYNPMEGYGQGSGLLVSLLPAFTVLKANMTLNSWNVPENNILSFQINAMNYYGTTTSSCVGFFQLGVDINENMHIAPWYVEGTNCIAHYFLSSNNPAPQYGFQAQPNSKLSLTIMINDNSTLSFQIIYFGSNGTRYFNATIAYSGTDFYSTYTQLEFQPSSDYPISDYYFNGSLYNIAYGNGASSMQPLNGTYMLPFILNAPPTWSFAYYQSSISGYQQIG